MRQLLEFLPLVLFFGAYQMDGDTVAVSDWSYTFDGIFSATAVLMVSTVVVWLLCSAPVSYTHLTLPTKRIV